MTSASLHAKNVRELQELAQHAPIEPRKRKSSSLSRAARLHLIDVLSRWSAPGLALLAGVSVYLAVVAGRVYPGRAFAWGLMALGALWVCRRLRSQFRAGANLADRPFRWRAAYTSSLSVLGVVLGSAPILLAPVDAPTALALQITALALFAIFAAALLHSAHFFSAAALAAPGALFAILTGLRAGETSLVLAAISTAILGMTGLRIANRYLEKGASRRYPRTAFIRREIETPSAGYASHTKDGSQALQA
ncbi:hypothetical protein PUV54_10950 [Hyphococcus flavus]|uniref:Uncharacterized protein n=1 Tax=Hyphococcus flavus TaxID=1866326 RepID=A0AAF0CBB1_9PROT|nr:hypothetical protein [Hyphococcus flavus]WDI30475.1 hypothetical protein PUV54_10950 [Hyphococcus flavus]